MTNSMFNPQPNYSGVTIQIANPAVYAGRAAGTNSCEYPLQGNAEPICDSASNTGFQEVHNPCLVRGVTAPIMTNSLPAVGNNGYGYIQPQVLSYPPQYYLNNYNYVNPSPAPKPELPPNVNPSGLESPETNSIGERIKNIGPESDGDIDKNLGGNNSIPIKNDDVVSDFSKNNDLGEKPLNDYTDLNSNSPQQEDMSKSENIIDDLDKRAAEAANEEKNKIKKDIVPLTDEYIKSLENYLNNPNDEIRLMASKEILTRLDEDKDRYNDAALNALLNKMLQDPSKLIRVAALSAFASQLASGNDYTVTLLHNIQQNPNADKEDVLQAADILLKMSAGKEVKEIPTPTNQQISESKG